MQERPSTPVTQPWVHALPFMQQTVLLTAIRAPDGLDKYHVSKYLIRWLRRCVLLSAMDGEVLENPYDPRGGSFTGPSLEALNANHFRPIYGLYSANRWYTASTWQEAMNNLAGEYMRSLDAVPHHYQLHFMHAVEIIGYKHPRVEIAAWFSNLYYRLVADMHLQPESMAMMDYRLADNREQWLEHNDAATLD